MRSRGRPSIENCFTLDLCTKCTPWCISNTIGVWVRNWNMQVISKWQHGVPGENGNPQFEIKIRRCEESYVVQPCISARNMNGWFDGYGSKTAGYKANIPLQHFQKYLFPVLKLNGGDKITFGRKKCSRLSKLGMLLMRNYYSYLIINFRRK